MLEKMNKIHEASMYILENIGMEFHDEEILELLRSKGVKVIDGRAYFTENQIMDAIKTVPPSFKIEARNPKYDIVMDQEKTHQAPAYGSPKVREFDGKYRDTYTKDFVEFMKLYHSSEHFNLVGGIAVQPGEVNQDLSYAIMMYTSIKMSDKCLIGIMAPQEGLDQMYKVLSIAFGGEEKLKEKPVMITLINTVSPLKLSQTALETLKMSCEYNQPVIFTPGPLGGATAPVTMAGYIAQGNAEALAGAAVTQYLKPGHPTVVGFVPRSIDMNTGGAPYRSPEYAMGSKYSSKFAKRYNMPHRGAGTQTDASGVTVQAGYEAMNKMYHMRESKANILLQGIATLDAIASVSYEKFVGDTDMFNMLNRYFDNRDNIGSGSTSLENIEAFIEQDNSKGCWVEDTLKDTPNELYKAKLDHMLKELYDKYERPYMDESVEKNLRDYMTSIGVLEETLNIIDEVECKACN